MPYRWEKREEMADVRSPGLWGHVCWFLGIIFAIIGIISGAIDDSIGLGATEWLLLAIVVLVASVPFFIGLASAWHLKTKEK